MDTIFKLLNWLFRAAIAVMVFLIAAELITKYTGALRWAVGVSFCVMGLGLYLGSVFFTRSYTINQTLKFANGEINDSARVVPKWVSFVCLLGISALFAAEILICIHVFA